MDGKTKFSGRITVEDMRISAQAFMLNMASQRAERSQVKAAVALARDQVRDAPDEEIVRYSGLFPVWTPGAPYAAGDIVRYGNVLYRVAQAHISQADWAPDRAASLFTVVRPPTADGTVLRWMAGEIVEMGELRFHDGVTYRCRQAHTTLAGWEPPHTPSLWEAI